ncbi:hypothetical protein I545_6969 [Mycobacterium kansasii 662]|uniref:Uncharacterized protein n=1 Tax=Mycobacterium kansasii 662 TaxID=1299326 RepID=X7XNS4_MYCKA|nr:hypothetical protein I545_6969 [Mycobacterium kansasii 662]
MWSSGMRASWVCGTPTTLVDELTGRCLQESRVDYTSFFRHLAKAAAATRTRARTVRRRCQVRWLAVAVAGPGTDAELMDRVNPVYIPRNHLVEEALTAARREISVRRTAPRRRHPPLCRTAGPGALRAVAAPGISALRHLLRHLEPRHRYPG